MTTTKWPLTNDQCRWYYDRHILAVSLIVLFEWHYSTTAENNQRFLQQPQTVSHHCPQQWLPLTLLEVKLKLWKIKLVRVCWKMLREQHIFLSVWEMPSKVSRQFPVLLAAMGGKWQQKSESEMDGSRHLRRYSSWKGRRAGYKRDCTPVLSWPLFHSLSASPLRTYFSTHY